MIRESNRDLLVFDLDGTLVDSQRDLTKAVNTTRVGWALLHCRRDTVARYVGNGAPVLVQRALPGCGRRRLVARAQVLSSSIIASTCWIRRGCIPAFESARSVARRWNSAGGADQQADSIHLADARRVGIDLHFFRVYGGNSFPEKKPDPTGMNALIAGSRADRDRTVMVGDSAVDVQTARNAGVRACGVRWGFQPETFVTSPPDFLIDDMRELTTMVRKRV